MRRRRLGAWGFEGEREEVSAELEAWLRERLGESSPVPRGTPSAPAAPSALPDLPGEVGVDDEDRLLHARGQGLPDVLRLRAGRRVPVPDAVLRPSSSREVERILQRCGAASVRVIPWGGGTSVTGGVNVPDDGVPTVSLDLERLAGIDSLDRESGLAVVGAGTTGPALEDALGAEGLTLGHLPQSWELSTLGGWIVTRSSGQESLGFGRIDDLVAGVELVAPDGVLDLSPTPSSGSGPDLRRLVLGSEGRLGVVIRAAVRVRSRPEDRTVRGWMLPSWDEAARATRDLARSGLGLSMVRASDPEETAVAMTVGLGDRLGSGLVRRYLGWRGVEGGCLLLVGAAGDAGERRRALGPAGSIVGSRGGVALGKEPGRAWLRDRFRHPYLRDALLEIGVATDTFETSVPWSRVASARESVRRVAESALEPDGEKVACLCHLSHPYRDGTSLYFTVFFRCPGDPDDAVERWATIKRRVTDAVVALGAPVSHHHGVGRWHAPWLPGEIGETGVELLRAAAATMDPDGILNRGVLVDGVDRLDEA